MVRQVYVVPTIAAWAEQPNLDRFDFRLDRPIDPRIERRLVCPTRQAGRAVASWLPHRGLVSLDRLATETIARSGWRLAPPVVALRALRSAVAAVLPGVEAIAAAKAWQRTVRDLLEARPGQDLASLDHHADRPLDHSSDYPVDLGLDSHLGLAIDLTERYRSLLAAAGWIDAATLFWQAAAVQSAQPTGATEAFWFHGDLASLADRAAFMDAIAGPGSVLILPEAATPLARLDQWRDRGWQIESWPLGSQQRQEDQLQDQPIERSALGTAPPTALLPDKPAANASHQAAYRFSYLEDEVRWVLAQVKADLASGQSAQDIALVTRDERRYGPILAAVAWEYDLPIRLLYPMPLAETRVGDWVRTLLDVVRRRWAYEPTTKLLKHPIAFDRLGSAWSIVRQRRPDHPAAWQNLVDRVRSDRDPSLARPPGDLDLSPLVAPKRQSREAWVDWLLSALRAFGVGRRSQRWAREALAYSRLRQELVSLARPSDEKLTFLDFAAEVADLLAIAAVAVQPGRSGVEVHRPASLVGAVYRSVYILGAAEGWLPAPIAADPVLDFSDRAALTVAGWPLPSAADLAQREQAELQATVSAAIDRLILTFPQSHRNETDLQASSAIAALGLVPQAPPSLPLASPEASRRWWAANASQDPDLTKPDPTKPDLTKPDLAPHQPTELDPGHAIPIALAQDPLLNHIRHAIAIEQRRRTNAPADEYDGVVGPVGSIDPRSRSFSASQLIDLGQCRFKWFAKKVLRLGQSREAEAELPANTKGTIYHAVLQKLFAAGWRGETLDPGQLQPWFEAAETELGLPAYVSWPAKRQEHLQQLQWTIGQANFFPHSVIQVLCEVEFTGEWHGLRVEGKVDRLDLTADGAIAIDYKTSKPEGQKIQDAQGNATIDLQLALYAQVAVPAIVPDQPAIDAYYYGLAEAKRHPVKATPPQEPPELSEFAETLKQHLRQGNYQIAPDRQGKACRYCDAIAVCRWGDRP